MKLPKEVPTQREPLTAQTLPQRAVSQSARKKAKAKAKKGIAAQAVSTLTPPLPTSNRFTMLGDLEQQTTNALTWANADPNFNLDDAIGYDRPAKTEIYPSVHVTAVPPSNFYTVAEVARAVHKDEHDTAKFKATTNARELAWGGDPRLDTSFAFGLRARFAVAHKLPDNREEVIARVTKDRLPSEHEAIITNLNKKLGGNEVIDAITPANWFRAHFMPNQLLTLDVLPATLEEVVEHLDTDNDLYEAAESFDIQLGGDGSGSTVLAALEGSSTLMKDSTCQALLFWACEPSPDDTSAAMAIKAHRIATNLTSQDGTPLGDPGLWFWVRLVGNYQDTVSGNWGGLSDNVLSLIAHAHANFTPISGGLPASRDLRQHILRAIADEERAAMDADQND